MEIKCEIKEIKDNHTLAVRTRAPVEGLPQAIGEAYGGIMKYLGELKQQPIGMPFVIYYNLDMQDLDVEIGFPVSEQFNDSGEIKASHLPIGKVASCIHMGPYEQMKPTYDAFTEWIQQNNYKTTGVVIEYYYNDPREVSSEEIMTEIQFLLK